MFFWYYLQFYYFDLEKFTSKKKCKYFFQPENWTIILLNIFSDNGSSCSCNCFFFQKFTQRVTILQTVSNQEVTLKRLIRMLLIAKSCVLGRKVIYVRCKNCSYNNVTKCIRLRDKKAFFVYTGKKIMQVRAFERYIIPLSLQPQV